MLLDARKKQPTTSLASPSRAHRRVLAEPTVPAPKPEAANANADAHRRRRAVRSRRDGRTPSQGSLDHKASTNMDASTATPGSPQDDASLSTLSSRPRPRRYRRKKHSMGRGFDAFLASKASKLARRRRDSSVQDCEKYTAEAATRGYAAVRERKRQDFILECGDKALKWTSLNVMHRYRRATPIEVNCPKRSLGGAGPCSIPHLNGCVLNAWCVMMDAST